ncbi:isopenicillin N synthase family oxygenase [Elioraea sp.]|uniref:isopenicillin N synthase family dioxygenase n=1 Tax=Elioraea sp. TaxID=2185103 RepID=UPI0025C21C9F|nr:2-oxoglutarate and iron-dependent oxygenase domain-containing protein [Elioraea sp.]
MSGYVPLIDISGFARGDAAAKAAVSAEVDRAFRTSGFLVLTGHGVPGEVIDAAFDRAHAFFALPVEEKLRAAPPSVDIFRGYNGIASQRSGNDYTKALPPDLRENFMMSRIDVADPYFRMPGFGKTYAPNIWPARPDDYREVWERFYREMDGLAKRLMRIAATALSMPEGFFEASLDRCSSTCVANHYPAQPEEPLPGQVRAGAHSDVGSVTLLLQERSRSGLQVLGRDDTWHDVVAARNDVIVNVGDLLAQWTNDVWVSTRHRVVNPPREQANTARMSLAFFQHPNYDAEIAPISSCVTAARPARYAPISAGEHMHRRMMQARTWTTDAAAD